MTSRLRRCSFSAVLVLTGCGLGGDPVARLPTTSASAAVTGRVRGGQQPVAGAAIQLYAVGTAGDGSPSTPLLTAAVHTDSGGGFNITGLYTCPASNPLVYLAATGGNPGTATPNPNLAVLTALGPCSRLSSATFISVDERTTVAAVAALSPFLSSVSAIGSSTVDAPALQTAFTLAGYYADPASGAVPGPSLPSGATAPVALINTLGNVLAACINSPGGIAGDGSACGNLFAATAPQTTVPAPTPPSDTVAAALYLMRDPITNAAALFNSTSPNSPFQPQLTAAPTSFAVNLSGSGAPTPVPPGCAGADLTGQSAFTNFTLQQPGVCRYSVPADLPRPFSGTNSTNYSTAVARAAGQLPIVPPGFKVTAYYDSLPGPRFLTVAPNGDLFVSCTSFGLLTVLRGVNPDGTSALKHDYAYNVSNVFGTIFYPSGDSPQYLLAATGNAVLRFPYSNGDLSASASPTTLLSDLPANGNHTTRALAFTNEATPRLLISVGSAGNETNTDTDSSEYHRADILAYSLNGTFQSIFASGLRNPVGLVTDSAGTVWTDVNERDTLGDNIPFDYVTHVVEGGFYGWPWYYNGPNPSPDLPLNHPELAAQTLVGDTLIQPHFAPIQLNFYTGTQFPAPYRGDLFVASHGSWNKSLRAGYEVLRVRIANGKATGDYEDFLTGFANPDGTVWGRPAGVVTGKDGALYVADDQSGVIWRITYVGK